MTKYVEEGNERITSEENALDIVASMDGNTVIVIQRTETRTVADKTVITLAEQT